jgi:hypothetical protein
LLKEESESERKKKMGTLVRQWVLNKLGLPVPEYSDPIQLRKGLSNGYIFAEILRKYSIISDDQLIALGHNLYVFIINN